MSDDPARRGEALPRCQICSCVAVGVHAHEHLWFLPHLDGTTTQPTAQEAERDAMDDAEFGRLHAKAEYGSHSETCRVPCYQSFNEGKSVGYRRGRAEAEHRHGKDDDCWWKRSYDDLRAKLAATEKAARVRVGVFRCGQCPNCLEDVGGCPYCGESTRAALAEGEGK